MNIRRHKLNADIGHIVHVMPNMKVDGCYSLALTLSDELKEYKHTLLTEYDYLKDGNEMILGAQSKGMHVCIADKITPENIDSGNYTGAILYNVEDHPKIGEVIPSIYYSYGIYDPGTCCDAVVACSDFATQNGRYKPYASKLDAVAIIPPMVQTRQLRRLAAKPHPYTVGLLTSGAYNKYPCKTVMQLLSKIPEDITINMSTLQKYPNPGMGLAMSDRTTRYPGRLLSCSVRPLAAIHYIVLCDAIIYASAEKHQEPYGRLVVEAMALGKPVICERRGIFASTLEHGVNALLFDTADEALDHLIRIQKDPEMASKLGTNAQMWASWQDVTVHLGKMKRTLRMVGA